MSRRSGLLQAALVLLSTTLARADFDSKLTAAVYHEPGNTTIDLNIRHAFGNVTAWAGSYFAGAASQQRLGVEYDFRNEWLVAIPSVQWATEGFRGASVYSEIGRQWFAIAGASRTNLAPYFNLTFDPNESLQAGVGRRLGEGEFVSLFTIWDVRLGTGQQDTHLVYRHHALHADRLTVDVLYKSGHTDDGTYVRGAGATLTWDWPRLFVRIAYDPYVNFEPHAMWRLSGGWRW